MVFHPAQSQLVKRIVLKTKMRFNNHPRLKAWVSKLRFNLWKMQVRWRTPKAYPAFMPHRTCWADPADIEYIFEDPMTTLVARKYANHGKIQGGNWDKLNARFEDTDHYQGFAAHFLEGVPWEQTPLYKRVIRQIKMGKVVYECDTQEAYDEKCHAMDRIFEEIRQNGYRPQKEIAKAEHDRYKAEDEISVCIGRHGDLLFEDGRHRLTIAKILRLNRVPIKITLVHKDWHALRMEIINYTKAHAGKVYQRIPHPDLADIPAVHDDRRFEIIRQHLPIQSGTLLDIGSHWGYFCHRFEDLGFDCHAIESSAKNVYFMNKLRRATNKRFHVHCCSIFEYKGSVRFNIVLALSVFHHFLKEKGSYEKLKRLLGQLDMDAMFFEPHRVGEPTMLGSRLDFSNDEFVDFILANSCLSRAQCLGETEDGRKIYLLER